MLATLYDSGYKLRDISKIIRQNTDNTNTKLRCTGYTQRIFDETRENILNINELSETVGEIMIIGINNGEVENIKQLITDGNGETIRNNAKMAKDFYIK